MLLLLMVSAIMLMPKNKMNIIKKFQQYTNISSKSQIKIPHPPLNLFPYMEFII